MSRCITVGLAVVASAILILAAPGFLAVAPALSNDLSIIPLWDGETRDPSDDRLNRFGGPTIAGSRATVRHTTAVVRTGAGAFQIDTNGTIPIDGFDFVATSLTSFGPTPSYVDTRDISYFREIVFWLRNATGAPFELVFEIKDYQDSNFHKARRSYIVSPGSEWTELRVPLDLSAGWTVIGTPDLTRAKLFALVIQATRGVPVSGSMYLDDMVLVEAGGPVDLRTASVELLAARLAERSFRALWGSRDRQTGLVPSISSFADIMATNVLAGLIKLLPKGIERGWVAQGEADAYVASVVQTLQQVMDCAIHLPPRYFDRVTRQAAFVREESSVDAAMLFLALYQYGSLPHRSVSLARAIETLLERFDFASFVSATGWRLAYVYQETGCRPAGTLTEGTYDGYSSEPWLISLSAHLSRAHHVPIGQLYHSAVLRVRDHLVDPSRAHLVHTSPDFRAPFLQWLLPLFVDVSKRGRDTYPDPVLAVNPHANAVMYQVEAVVKAAQSNRPTRLQPDAADDGSGINYQQFSFYRDFGLPDLFMPWSAAFALLADDSQGLARQAGEAALREHLNSGLHGPFGLSDAVHWPTGGASSTHVTARNDLWNVALSTMALVQYLFGGNEQLASVEEVRTALDQVFDTPLHDFVAEFYSRLLGRTPPRTEVEPWVAFLETNCHPDGMRQFAGGFLHGDEYSAQRTRVAERVTVLYDLFLGRPPDPGGQAGWTAAFIEAFHALLPGFVTSAEFQHLLATTSTESLVIRFYVEILGRQPAIHEVQAWGSYLQATGDYSGFARGFFGSPEYLARSLSLHAHVAIVYATFLGRAPDAPGGAAWADFLSNQFQPIYNGFIDSPEFQARLVLCE